MKILEYIPQLGIGGAERFCLDLSNELAKDNEVILCVSHSIPELSHYLKELSSRVRIICFYKSKGIDLRLPFRVLRLIKQEKPDIVHTHLMSLVYTALSAIVYRKVKYFHTIHNAALQESDGRIGSLVRRFLFGYKFVIPIAISKQSAKSFKEFYGFSAITIYNGRDLPDNVEPSSEVVHLFSKIRTSPDTKVIVQLAHVGYQKRQIVMANAISRLNKNGINIVVLMIGTIDEKAMADQIKKLNNTNIIMLGPKSNPLDYLKLADGFGLSSEYEGLPISLIEALGMGAVPICTPVGGIVDIVKDGVNGFLADSISEEDYYIALKRFADLNNEALNQMKDNAKESYKFYTMTNCAALYNYRFRKSLRK